MDDRRDGDTQPGMNADTAPAGFDDDDLLAEAERRRPWPWHLGRWIVGGVAGLALFAGLAVGFTHLLEDTVRHVPAAQVLRTLPSASATAASVATSAAPPSPASTPAAPQPAPASTPAAAVAAAPDPTTAPLPKGPRIVLLLADAGANPSLTRRAIEQLPREVAFGFNPYPENLAAFVQQARAKGHEIWLGVPMEPQGYPRMDPGPQAMLLASSPAQNLKRLEWALRQVEGEVGLYSIMGSAFTANEAALRPVLAAVAQKGLPFLDSRATGRTRSPRMAEALGLTLLVNDSFVGSPATVNAIDSQLATLERLARSRGLAVGVIEPSSLVLERLGPWAAGLAAKNISLVPPRALLDAEATQD